MITCTTAVTMEMADVNEMKENPLVKKFVKRYVKLLVKPLEKMWHRIAAVAKIIPSPLFRY